MSVITCMKDSLMSCLPKAPLTASRSLVAGLAAFALASAGALPVLAQDTAPGEPDVQSGAADEAKPITKGEARLAKLLEGRVAGEPVRCIRTMPSQRMQTIDRTAYVYGSGNTIYVQRTNTPDRIDDTDTLVSIRFNASELCRLDVMNTVDRFNGFFTGAVFFEDFVPYTRVKAGPASDS
jgi:hypothetical protein